MAASQNKPIQADSSGLDAMAASQNKPIQADSSGLDAMKAWQQSGTTLLEDQAAKEKAKTASAEARRANDKAKAKANRDSRKLQRGLRQAEITGRVNQFVRDWATQNAAHVRAVNSRGETVNTAQIPNVGTLDLGTGKIIDGPLFDAPTSFAKSDSASSTAALCVGLGLYTRTVGTPPVAEVWVGVGTVAGDLPPGFDPTLGKLVASGGTGTVWAAVTINGTTGAVESVAVNGGGATPNDTNTSFYYTLGSYAYVNGFPTIANYGCGSLSVTVCRNWFTAEPPFFGVTITR